MELCADSVIASRMCLTPSWRSDKSEVAPLVWRVWRGSYLANGRRVVVWRMGRRGQRALRPLFRVVASSSHPHYTCFSPLLMPFFFGSMGYPRLYVATSDTHLVRWKESGRSTAPNETSLLYPDIVCGDSRAMASCSMVSTPAAVLCTHTNVLTASIGYLFRGLAANPVVSLPVLVKRRHFLDTERSIPISDRREKSCTKRNRTMRFEPSCSSHQAKSYSS
jgi:hypothetical protein